MTAFTTAEQIENLERTIAATERNIHAKKVEIEDLESVTRLNKKKLIELKTQARLENSPKARYDRAVKSLRKDGVHFRTNMMKCCRGCITGEDLGVKSEDQPYGYTYGGQGGWVKFNEDGLPYEKEESRWKGDYRLARDIFINWGNGSAEKIVEAFKAQGFEVQWNGNDWDTVRVILVD